MITELLAAQDGLARLEGEAGMAPEAVREGLVARMGVREAGGWLAHHGSWVHPVDLALREAGVTGSYAAAELGMRLASVLPATQGEEPPPEDRDVAAALALAGRWRRLALRGWAPDGMGAAAVPALPAVARCIAGLEGGEGQGRRDRLSGEAVLRGAWLWREGGGTGVPPMPFWSAPVAMLHRLALAPTEAGALAAIAAAAAGARRMLGRLLAVPEPAGRGRLAEARAVALRRPVVTARMLADALGVSLRGALDLIGRMEAAGVLREATGRRAWRAFVIPEGVW